MVRFRIGSVCHPAVPSQSRQDEAPEVLAAAALGLAWMILLVTVDPKMIFRGFTDRHR
jgi:hypothetical protein